LRNEFLLQFAGLRRRAAGVGLAKGACVGLTATAVLVGAGGVAHAVTGQDTLWLVAVSSVAFCFVALLWGALRGGEASRVLRAADRRLDLKDRLQSAWEFMRVRADPMAQLQLRDATAAVTRADPRRAFPFRPPLPAFVYSIAFLCALAGQALPLLVPDGPPPERRPSPLLAPPVKDAVAISRQLDEIAAEAKRKKLRAAEERARRLAELARKLADGKVTQEELLSRAAEAETSGAVEGLARLADQLRQIAKKLAVAEVWKQPVQALRQAEPAAAARHTRRLASSMREGDLSKGAMQQLLRQMRQAAAGSERRALKRLSKRQDLSDKALKNFNPSDLSKSVDSFADELSSVQEEKDKLEMLKELAELARKLKGRAGEETLANREQRRVKGGKPEGGRGAPGERSGDRSVPLKGPGAKAGRDGKSGKTDKPGDGLGSGAGDKSLGDPSKRLGKPKLSRVKGKASPFSRDRAAVVKNAALSGGSAVGYAEIYSRAARAAENTVDRSDMPLASRLLVKRYFLGIAPTERAAPKAKEQP